MQQEYVSTLKAGDVLKDLLLLTFDFLVRTRSPKHIVNPSRFELESYAPSVEDTPEADSQWLISHLYYLCLMHLPLLTRDWWRSDCPRQLDRQVEEWTEKYVC